MEGIDHAEAGREHLATQFITELRFEADIRRRYDIQMPFFHLPTISFPTVIAEIKVRLLNVDIIVASMPM